MKFFNTIPGDGEVAILLYGDVGDGQKVDSGRVVSELMALQAQYDKIDVRINSNGGDVFSGIAIYNALRTSKADITIYVDGVAASIAGIIALCGKPLYMSPYAKLMLHAVSGGTWGNASALRQTASMMETLQGDLARMIAHRCGMEAKEVTARYFDEKDHWISAEEAVSMKLADGLYDMGEKPETEPKTAGEVYQYFNNRLQTQPQNQNKDMALLEELKKMPTFKDVNSEAELLMKAQQLENQATKAEALEKANKAYKEKAEAAETAEVEAIVNKAVSDGKIGKEQVATFKALMKSDRANTESLLKGMKAQKPQMRAAAYIDENFYPDNSFASKSIDDSTFVSYKTVHIPNAGTPSGVEINRTKKPASVSQRTDNELTYDMDELTTNPIYIPNIDTVELSYDKRNSVLCNDRQQLQKVAAQNLLYRWAKGANTLSTSGAAREAHTSETATGNRKKFTKAVVMKAMVKMNVDDVPTEGRYMLLDAVQYADLLDDLTDKELSAFQALANVSKGVMGQLYGFSIMQRSKVLRVKADGSTVIKWEDEGEATELAAGLAWQQQCVSRALGDVKMFSNEDDPQYYGDIYSFLVRVGGSPRRYDKKGVYLITEGAAA